MVETRLINIKLLELNEGQLYGLPKNPRWIRDTRFEALKKSIEDAPEMLALREILVYPLDDVDGKAGKYIVIGGNMRLRACREIGYSELPCKVLDIGTSVKKLREYVIKDNEAFGQNDWETLGNEWDEAELQSWGMEIDALSADDVTDITSEDASGGGEGDTRYSRNIEAPVYQITGEEPSISECFDMTATRRLLKEIDGSSIPEEQKEMLRVCAYRHTKINFAKMAEYYAHQNAEMQSLMENNALVIIDFNKAVDRGFVEMTSKLLALIPDGGNDGGADTEEDDE